MALSADRKTPERESDNFEFPVLAGAKIYAGSLVVLDASGWAKPGVTATGLVAVGKAQAQADNTNGQNGDIKVKVRIGRAFRWANSDVIAKDSIGDTAYIVDDQTVAKGSSGKSPAGIIVDVDSDGVWVYPPYTLALVTTGLLVANNLSDVGTAATAAHNLGLGTADTPTFAGLTLTGAAVGTTGAFTGTVTGLHPTAVKTTTYAVATATDADAVLQSLTDGEVFNLPACAAGNKGQKITFQNTAADGAALIKVEPNGTNKIKGQVGSVEASGASSKGLWNTKATQKQGDHVTIMSDGTDVWWIVGGIGVWASET